MKLKTIRSYMVVIALLAVLSFGVTRAYASFSSAQTALTRAVGGSTLPGGAGAPSESGASYGMSSAGETESEIEDSMDDGSEAENEMVASGSQSSGSEMENETEDMHETEDMDEVDSSEMISTGLSVPSSYSGAVSGGDHSSLENHDSRGHTSGGEGEHDGEDD